MCPRTLTETIEESNQSSVFVGQQLGVIPTDILTNILTDKSRDRHKKRQIKRRDRGFPGGAVVENLPANAGDTGSSPGLGRSHMPRSD